MTKLRRTVLILGIAAFFGTVLLVWLTYGWKLLAMGMKEKDRAWIDLTHESYRYCREGEYWKSIELAERALERNPRASEAWRLIGNSYELLGDEEEMAGNYERAKEYHGKATEAWNKAKNINPRIMIPFYHE